MNDKLIPLLTPIVVEIAGHPSGILGAPHGELAYAYVRVSTSGQAEEGRTGLPRQLLHIHQCAIEKGLRVPFELLYADDHSGFEFQNRPDLQRFLHDVAQHNRYADHVIIENLDRLSRNAKWHQGYLLDTMEQSGLEVHFWKGFHSDIERAVMGAISEQGMRHEIERMYQGMKMKARSGRITAKTRAYGYLFADSEGRPSTDPASKYRKDTHYILHPDEAPVMREAYERIIAGESLMNVCDSFERRGIPTPKASKYWTSANLSKMLKSPLYKGEFVANRYYKAKGWSERKQQTVMKVLQRPQEEWIISPVPPIVTPQMWEEAQKAQKRKLKTSTRKSKSDSLLQGMLVCARCGSNYRSGGTARPRKNIKRYFYICNSYHGSPLQREHLYCKSPILYKDEIDPLIWEAVCQLITDPEILMGYIEEENEKFQRGELTDQLQYIERQLKQCEREAHQWDRAFAADILDIQEYQDKKHAVSLRQNELEQAQEKIADEMALVIAFERKREVIHDHLTMIQESGFALDLPFKEKRRIVAMLVDRVVIESEQGWYRIEGAIEGTYQFKNIIEDGDFTYIPDP